MIGAEGAQPAAQPERGRLARFFYGGRDARAPGRAISARSLIPHFSPRCATAWNKQCHRSGLRLALLVPSSGTLVGVAPVW